MGGGLRNRRHTRDVWVVAQAQDLPLAVGTNKRACLRVRTGRSVS